MSGDENKRRRHIQRRYDDDGPNENKNKWRKRRKLLQILKRIQESERNDEEIIDNYDNYDDYYYDYDVDQLFLTSDPLNRNYKESNKGKELKSISYTGYPDADCEK